MAAASQTRSFLLPRPVPAIKCAFARETARMYKMPQGSSGGASHRSGRTMLLTFLAGFPTYFMMSIGTGADPLSAVFCAWLGISVAQGVVRGAPTGMEPAAPPPLPVNKCAHTVPQRFRLTQQQTA